MPPKRSRAALANVPDVSEPSAKKVREEQIDLSNLTKDMVPSLTHAQVREALGLYGENPGPINDGTRSLYDKMLVKRVQEGSAIKTFEASTTSPSKGRPSSSPAARQSFASTSVLKTESPLLAKSSTLTSKWKSSPGSSGPSPRTASGVQSRKTWPTTVVSSSPSVPRSSFSSRLPEKPIITAQATRGLVAATYTPLTSTGSINTAVIDEYARHLIRNNVSGVFVNGTTGEGVKFSVEERKDLVEKWIKAANGQLAVFVHVGAESVKDAQEMATHANDMGAHAIAVIAPTMLKPKSADHMVDYCAAVALAAPDVPMYFYHIPPLTHTTFSIEDFLDSAVKRIPSFVGVKYSDPDLALFGACRYHSNGDLHLMYGKDEQLLAALAMGAHTFVGSTYNLYPKLYHEIASAYENGEMDAARELQLFSWEVIKVLLRYGGVIPAGRSLLDYIGVKVGPPRVPDRAPDASSIKNMIQELKTMDFFKWA